MSSTSEVRREVHYSGRVQGVGFRWTARHVAQSYAVTGFVKNLADRRVFLVAEGEPAELDRFLADLAEKMGANIRDAAVVSLPATGEYSSFEIVH
ncbi:MAG: acylphosphatase [Planctomycetaceae bacterium]|nr:acylphosphatase [Planctomycetaceae bacterium]